MGDVGSEGECSDQVRVTAIPLSVELSLLPCLLPSILQPLDRQNNYQAEHGDDSSADTDAIPPPLGVKLTGYRLFFVTIVFSFGVAKSILAYKGLSIAPTTLDWVSGTFLTIV